MRLNLCVCSMTLLKVDFPTNTLQLISPHLPATLFPLKFSALQCNSTLSGPHAVSWILLHFFLSLLFPDPLGPLWLKALPAQLSGIGRKRYPFLDVNKSVTSLTAQFISSRSNLPVHAECFGEAASVCACVCVCSKEGMSGKCVSLLFRGLDVITGGKCFQRTEQHVYRS